MVSTTFNSVSVFLLTAEPQGGVRITVSRLTERHASRTRREERYLLGATLRWKLDYKTIIDDRLAAQTFRLSLRDYANEPILCPFWPAAVPFSEAGELKFTGGLRCTWEPDFTQWELHTGSSPGTFTPSAEARIAPVLWGRFGTMPDPDLVTAEIPAPEIAFVETGPRTAPTLYAIAPASGIEPHTGPELHGDTHPLLDFELDFKRLRTGGVDVQIARQRLGFGRLDTEAFHPQTPRAIEDCTAILPSMAELARLVATFHTVGGTVAPLWFPSIYAPTRLTADTSAESAVISVENGDALGGHPHIILRDFGGANIARTVENATSNALTLDSSPGNLSAGSVSLQLLFFGRFRGDELTINWRSPLDISAQFGLTELPSEYGNPDGETHGATIGHVASPIYLLEITDQVDTVWRWTNYEAGLLVDEEAHTHVPFAWNRIQERLNLDDSDLELSIEAFIGNPFMRLTEPHRGKQLTIVLKEWNAAGAADPEVIFRGFAFNADPVDTVLKVPVVSEGKRLFDMRVPRRLDGPTCSWLIYGAGCKMTAASKAVAATGVSQPATLQVKLAVSGLIAASYFAGGWLKRAVPGEGDPTYGVIDNTAVSGGEITVTLDSPFAPALTGGEGFTLYPACTQTWESCAALGNTANFGGARNKPAANPAFVPIKRAQTATSKK